jgi:hypothetical protein
LPDLTVGGADRSTWLAPVIGDGELDRNTHHPAGGVQLADADFDGLDDLPAKGNGLCLSAAGCGDAKGNLAGWALGRTRIRTGLNSSQPSARKTDDQGANQRPL